MPSFPGGANGWRIHLEKNLRYPETAQKKGTQGTATVKFKVEPDGTLKDFAIVQDPGNGLGNETVRVLKEGPKWNPASQNGHLVTAEVKQSVYFRLE